ncbi:hypothetical protein [Streptomyces sp. NPDC006997]|uniref:hypothetical protein n=1 Tax=Streptomyces sp. NPDC006997 TaxID=3155356 RepID=UPI0033D0F419
MISGFLSELGKKFAERWFTLLVLPGALYLAVATAARTLGHCHALDVPYLARRITDWAASPDADTVGGQVVLLAGVLGGSATAGILAQALGATVERTALAAGWRDLRCTWLRERVAGRVDARRARWTTAARAWHRQQAALITARSLRRPVDNTAVLAARRTMDAIALESPDRPTWCGDRLNAVAVRLRRDLGFDLAVCWPGLWLTLPDTDRDALTEARRAVERATALAAWAVLYTPLVVWWWPALPLGLTLALLSRRRTRAATDAYAQLTEAVSRLHLRALGDHLGLDPTVPAHELGPLITARLEPSGPPRP